MKVEMKASNTSIKETEVREKQQRKPVLVLVVKHCILGTYSTFAIIYLIASDFSFLEPYKFRSIVCYLNWLNFTKKILWLENLVCVTFLLTIQRII